MKREAAFRCLRTVFAEVYNELRRRGRVVLVEYDDPGDPFYIPRVIEIDHVPITLAYHVTPDGRSGYLVQLTYIPSNAARVHGGAKRENRPMKVDGTKKIVDWLDRVVAVERAMFELNQRVWT
jgi:hypothetical protein